LLERSFSFVFSIIIFSDQLQQYWQIKWQKKR